MSDESPINPDDFISIRTSISFDNLTSRTQLLVKPDSPSTVELLEVLEQGLVLEVPARSCSLNHHLDLHIDVFSPNGGSFRFNAGSKVVSTEKVSAELQRIVLTLVQFEANSWERFREIFSSRQEEIDRFFRATKG